MAIWNDGYLHLKRGILRLSEIKPFPNWRECCGVKIVQFWFDFKLFKFSFLFVFTFDWEFIDPFPLRDCCGSTTGGCSSTHEAGKDRVRFLSNLYTAKPWVQSIGLAHFTHWWFWDLTEYLAVRKDGIRSNFLLPKIDFEILTSKRAFKGMCS